MIRLASSSPMCVTDMRTSMLDLFRSKNSSALSSQVMQPIMHRPIPAPEPNPEPNPGPDGVTPSKRTSRTSTEYISAEDWDQLFHAAEVRLLEHCVDQALHTNSQLPPQDSLVKMKAAVLECVSDMKLLHVSLKTERQKWQEHQRHQQYQELEKQQQSSDRADH
jgi:hypothetical protein